MDHQGQPIINILVLTTQQLRELAEHEAQRIAAQQRVEQACPAARMLDALELMAECKVKGIELAANGEMLRYRPHEAVTPELLERLKASKPELLSRLQG